MKELEREEVLSIPAIMNGEIALCTAEYTMRGPIKFILDSAPETIIILHWSAMLDDNDDWFHAPYSRKFQLHWTARFFLGDYGIVMINSPDLVVGAIYPRGTGRLDPKIVHRLPKKFLGK